MPEYYFMDGRPVGTQWDVMKCPKCGICGFDVEFKEETHYPTGDGWETYPEELLVTCRTCGYSDRELPLDERTDNVQEQEISKPTS